MNTISRCILFGALTKMVSASANEESPLRAIQFKFADCSHAFQIIEADGVMVMIYTNTDGSKTWSSSVRSMNFADTKVNLVLSPPEKTLAQPISERDKANTMREIQNVSKKLKRAIKKHNKSPIFDKIILDTPGDSESPSQSLQRLCKNWTIDFTGSKLDSRQVIRTKKRDSSNSTWLTGKTLETLNLLQELRKEVYYLETSSQRTGNLIETVKSMPKGNRRSRGQGVYSRHTGTMGSMPSTDGGAPEVFPESTTGSSGSVSPTRTRSNTAAPTPPSSDDGTPVKDYKGWTERWTTFEGAPYKCYRFVPTAHTQWMHPNQLRRGWLQCFDEKSNAHYYQGPNEETQWEKP